MEGSSWCCCIWLSLQEALPPLPPVPAERGWQTSLTIFTCLQCGAGHVLWCGAHAGRGGIPQRCLGGSRAGHGCLSSVGGTLSILAVACVAVLRLLCLSTGAHWGPSGAAPWPHANSSVCSKDPGPGPYSGKPSSAAPTPAHQGIPSSGTTSSCLVRPPPLPWPQAAGAFSVCDV